MPSYDNPISNAHRYVRIAMTLRAEIENGHFQVGTLLPTESELADRFGVSRQTVREALRGLVEEGLVARRRGSGTRVVAPTPKNSYVHAIQSLYDIVRYMEDTRISFENVQTIVLTAADSAIVPAPEGSRWLKIVGSRELHATGEMVAATEVYINSRFSNIFTELDSHRGPIFPLIEKKTGEIVAQVKQVIEGSTMPSFAAQRLNVQPGTPAVRVLRRFVDVSGGPMLTSVNWHPLEGFSYEITLDR